jgi:hypothetical protein
VQSGSDRSFDGHSGQGSPTTRASRRSSFPRPYICRFTSFSSWRVLAGQELIGDYEDFRVPVCLVEQQPNICLTLLIHLKLGDQRAIDLVGDILGIDRLAPFRRQKLVERLLEFRAGLRFTPTRKAL